MDDLQRLNKTIEFLTKRLVVYEPDLNESLRRYLAENVVNLRTMNILERYLMFVFLQQNSNTLLTFF